ncbi:hypothetical protein [Actinomadura miaoliensis]|uniref:C2H2-type domain-containing protein n=1 Tax=Actinomadura miaoliensis TaxID=430685 RepID=A0ABP7WB14_9ACTN
MTLPQDPGAAPPSQAAMGAAAEPIAITVTRYLCPYCRRGHSKKAAAARHIARCWWSPAAKGCKTCALYEPEITERDTGYRAREHCGAEGGPDLAAGGIRTGCALWGPREEAVDA